MTVNKPKVFVQFKGTASEYSKLHYWVAKQLGRPKLCENCLIKDVGRYDWANISGEYKKDLSDWARLCSSCHYRFDRPFRYRGGRIRGEHCKYGHIMDEVNARKKHKSDGKPGGWECRICHRLHNSNSAKRLREAANPGKTAYEVCYHCLGSGMQDSLRGPETCDECNGDCSIRVRDEKGRFTTIAQPPTNPSAEHSKGEI